MMKLFTFLALTLGLSTVHAQTQVQTQSRPSCDVLAAEAAKTLWALNTGIDMKLLRAEIIAQSRTVPKFHKVVVRSKLSKDVTYRVLTNPLPNSNSCQVVQVTMEESYH